MRRGKAIRWHVDQMTEAGMVLGAWVRLGGNECTLVAGYGPLPVPIAGFGSSDCRQCRSHLLRWPDGKALPRRFAANRHASPSRERPIAKLGPTVA